MNKVIFRSIQKKDLDEVFLLLQQMSKIDYSKRDKNKSWKLFKSCSSESIVGIIDNKVIAYGSLVLEYKIRGSISGHIEDIVVSDKVRHQNIGTSLIKELVNIAFLVKSLKIEPPPSEITQFFLSSKDKTISSSMSLK